MALTCSHKILKAHSNEALGHNAEWPSALWRLGSPQSVRGGGGGDSFSHCTVDSGCLVESNYPLSLLLHEHMTHTVRQDNVTLHLCSNSALAKSLT